VNPPSARGGFNKFPSIIAQIDGRIDAVVRLAAFNIAERARTSMEGAKGGRIYRLPGGQMHQASAPGEPPAILFGTLHGSIDLDFPKPGQAFVYTTDEKAPYLEFGTIYMEPRPWLEPAAEAEREPFVAAMTAALRGLS
jgi:hypothetical protein